MHAGPSDVWVTNGAGSILISHAIGFCPFSRRHLVHSKGPAKQETYCKSFQPANQYSNCDLDHFLRIGACDSLSQSGLAAFFAASLTSERS